jgi:hypothetical protein
MRKSPRPQQLAQLLQLKLFHRTPASPLWAQLPQEIRQQTAQLLARLLREHRALVASRGATEAADE